MSKRKMQAYGEREHGGRYILDDYNWSRNHHRAETIRRWKRNLKKKARAKRRMQLTSMGGWQDAETDAGNGEDETEQLDQGERSVQYAGRAQAGDFP